MKKIIFLTFCFIQFQALSFDIIFFNNSDNYIEVQFLTNGWCCCHKLLHKILLPDRNISWQNYIKSKQKMIARILINDIPQEDYIIEPNKKYKFVISNDRIYKNIENKPIS